MSQVTLLATPSLASLSAELGRNVPLSAMAAERSCSPVHLMRVFRAVTGLTVRGYRRQLRVLSARP